MIIKKTQTICPVCHKPLNGAYQAEFDRNAVYLEMDCPDHGHFETLASEDIFDFINWIEHPVINVPPRAPQTEGIDPLHVPETGSECPLHCGLCRDHRQTACCVLIDLTTRCNQHCPFCFAVAEGQGEDLPFETVLAKLDYLIEIGEERPFNLQLSGGEPTVRDDLPEIIRAARDRGFQYIQINSNGKRIGEEPGYAEKLKAAGASAVFMQFDGTGSEIYMETRGQDLLETKLKAIQACRKARLPVSLVPTVIRGVNDANIGDMVRFMLDNLDVVKGIHFQPASFFGRVPEGSEEKRITMFGLMREIEKQTGGLIKYEDLCPITSGHTLCCFTGSFLRQQEGSVKSILSQQQKSQGVGCCEEYDPLDIISRDRDFVLNQWQLPETGEFELSADSSKDESLAAHTDESSMNRSDSIISTADIWAAENKGAEKTVDPALREEAMSLDGFINYYRANSFTISGMAFMDCSNLDADRLSRCRVQVLAPDNRLIPFCAYNSIYR